MFFYIFFVQDIRVELIRPHRTADFESAVSTNFTNPACDIESKAGLEPAQ